jgi:tetratricopeptide (TPR) repeat protein
MKKKSIFIFQFAIFLGFVLSVPCLYSFEINQDIAKAYSASDYATVAKLLEQQIESSQGKASQDQGIDEPDLSGKYLFLGHIQAWRLNNLEKGLAIFEEVLKLKPSSKDLTENKRLPPTPLMFIAEIYEAKKDHVKARENYQRALAELVAYLDKESEDLSVILAEDLIKLTRYQVDGINLKMVSSLRQKPLLKKLKLTSQLSHQIAAFSALGLSPTAGYDFSMIQEENLVDHIRRSPPDIGSMASNYALVLNISAGSVTKMSERAMEAYLSKYPEGYYSLSLRYLFYKFYKASGQLKKAGALLKDLEKIGKKRGMELIVGPDKRFSSPEKTWRTYRSALIEGNLELAMECYLPGRIGPRKVFEHLGREKMKEIGKSMGDIHKVESGEAMAEYMIIRKEKGQEISYGIYFHNRDGEWKMQEFYEAL